MTVAELITLLQTFPQDALVVQSKDAEGNQFSPTVDIGLGRYAAETTWYGEFGIYELTPEAEAEGYTDEDILDAPPAVCIWPTN